MSQAEDDPPGHEGATQIGRAIILIIVVVVVAVLVLHRVGSSNGGQSSSAATTTTTAPSTSTTKPKSKTTPKLIAPSKIKVQVLNGLQTDSLAGNLSTTLKSGSGYNTLPANNTTAKATTSKIYVVTSGYYQDAKRLASTLGLTKKSITRGVPSAAPIPSGVASQANLIVVIGTSLQAKAGG